MATQAYLADGDGDGTLFWSAAETEADAKRRRVMRACDVCRRKKIRCEGPMTSNVKSKCAHCQEYSLECTYVEAATRRGPPKGYVDALEQRCDRLERIIQQLRPDLDITAYAGPGIDRDYFDQSTYGAELRAQRIPALPLLKPLPAHLASSSPSGASHSATPPTGAPSPSVSVLGPQPWQAFERAERAASPPHAAAEDRVDFVTDDMTRLSVYDGQAKYYGTASGKHLFEAVSAGRAQQSRDFVARLSANSRPQFWLPGAWERDASTEGIRPIDWAVWPEPELAETLIDAYFEHVNTNLPLLNSVIFRKQFASEMYKTHHGFARVCLLVFANGARHVDDERVYWSTASGPADDPADDSTHVPHGDETRLHSAGWKYFVAALRMGRALLAGPDLFLLQTVALSCCLGKGNAESHFLWFMAGSALRSAQEIGAHVRHAMLRAHPAERALFNRAFWCLYHFDRVECAAIGRSVAIADTDFDAEYPLAVDDEYWDTGDPATDYKQPASAGAPRITAFIHMLKLDHVLGAVLRTVYAVKSTPDGAQDTPPPRAVVAELDSALTAWQDGLPAALRWDPDRADVRALVQSAALHAHFHYIQILIHRTFIPTPLPPPGAPAASSPSLAICSHAARSICTIIRTVLARAADAGTPPGRRVPIGLSLASVTAVVVVLANMYAGRQGPADRARSIRDIRAVVAAFRDLEIRHRQAGKMTDVIVELSREAERDAEGDVGGEVDDGAVKRRLPDHVGGPGDGRVERKSGSPHSLASRSTADGSTAVRQARHRFSSSHERAVDQSAARSLEGSPASRHVDRRPASLDGHPRLSDPTTHDPVAAFNPGRTGLPALQASVPPYPAQPPLYDPAPQRFVPADAPPAPLPAPPPRDAPDGAFERDMLALFSGAEFRPPDALTTSLFGGQPAPAPYGAYGFADPPPSAAAPAGAGYMPAAAYPAPAPPASAAAAAAASSLLGHFGGLSPFVSQPYAPGAGHDLGAQHAGESAAHPAAPLPSSQEAALFAQLFGAPAPDAASAGLAWNSPAWWAQ